MSEDKLAPSENKKSQVDKEAEKLNSVRLGTFIKTVFAGLVLWGVLQIGALNELLDLLYKFMPSTFANLNAIAIFAYSIFLVGYVITNNKSWFAQYSYEPWPTMKGTTFAVVHFFALLNFFFGLPLFISSLDFPWWAALPAIILSVALMMVWMEVGAPRLMRIIGVRPPIARFRNKETT